MLSLKGTITDKSQSYSQPQKILTSIQNNEPTADYCMHVLIFIWHNNQKLKTFQEEQLITKVNKSSCGLEQSDKYKVFKKMSALPTSN